MVFGMLGLLNALGHVAYAREMMTDGDWVFELDKAFHILTRSYAALQVDLGRVAIAVAAFYVLSSLLLLLRVRQGVALFRLAAGAAIISALIKGYIATWPDGYMGFMMSWEVLLSTVSCVANVGLLIGLCESRPRPQSTAVPREPHFRRGHRKRANTGR